MKIIKGGYSLRSSHVPSIAANRHLLISYRGARFSPDSRRDCCEVPLKTIGGMEKIQALKTPGGLGAKADELKQGPRS